MNWELIGVVVLIIYCFGALIGGGYALYRLNRDPTPEGLHGHVQQAEMGVMWTFFWFYCLYQYFVHRNDSVDK